MVFVLLYIDDLLCFENFSNERKDLVNFFFSFEFSAIHYCIDNFNCIFIFRVKFEYIYVSQFVLQGQKFG